MHTVFDFLLQDIYVLDTGIQSNHSTFASRVIHGFDSISSPALKYDPHGHGTQVAGIIAGSQRGLCRNANVIDVRVADIAGKSQTHHLLAGLDYIIGIIFFCTYFLLMSQSSCSPGRTLSLNQDPFDALINLGLSSHKQSKVLRYALYRISKGTATFTV
jgi:subtilisin family serine protease